MGHRIVSRCGMSLAPRRVGLTGEAIAGVALRILERDGPEALSMRKLALDLDVTPATIYWHVGNRDEVVAAALELFRSRNRPAKPRGVHGRSRIVSILRQIRAEAVEHAQVFRAAYAAGLTGRLELPWQQLLARELLDTALSPGEAADVLRGLLYTVAGFLAMGSESSRETIGNAEAWAKLADGSIDETLRARMATTEPDDVVFERTITALVDALVPAENGATR